MTRHLLDAKVYPANVEALEVDEDGKPVPLEFEDVNYVSFVVFNTWGPPPVLAEQKDQSMKAAITAEIEEHGDVTVLYLNPQNITAAEITRRA